MPEWLESVWGSYAAPVVIQAQSGRGTVVFNTYLNMRDCRCVGILLHKGSLICGVP